MANYMSTLDNFNQVQSPLDINLINNVLNAKQQKFDQNLAKVDQTLAELGQVENLLVRQQDKEYFANNVQAMLDTVNRSGKINWSSTGITRQIQGQIKGILDDDYLMQQISNSQKINAFQTEVGELKKKNDGRYNDINYAFAMNQAGIQEYMSGQDKEGNKVDNIGELSYHNYTDYQKKINDFILDLEGKKKDQVVQIPDGKGNMIETKMSGLSPVQLRSVAESMLDVNDTKQMQIDGWYNTGGYDNPNTAGSLINSIDKYVGELDDNIGILEKKLENKSLSKKHKASYEAQLHSLTTEKADKLKNKDVFANNPAAAATYLQQEKVIQNTAARFAGLYTETQKIVADEVYWKQKNYDLNLAKFKYTLQKDAADRAAKKKQESFSVISKGYDAEENYRSVEQEYNDTVNGISTELDQTLNTYKTEIETLSNSGNASAKKTMDMYTKRLKTKKPYESDIDVFRGVLLEADNLNDELSVIGDTNYKAKIRQLSSDLSLYTDAKKEIDGKAISLHTSSTLDSEKTLRAFAQNRNTKMMYNGNAVSVYSVLKDKGIIDADGNKLKSIQSDPEVFEQLKDSYYADDFLSSFSQGNQSTYSSTFDPYDNSKLEKVYDSFGETLEDILTPEALTRLKSAKEKGTTPLARLDYINTTSKTGKLLHSAAKSGLYDRTSFLDQSLSGDDSDIGSFVRNDYKNSEVYRRGLSSLRAKLPNTQVIGVSKDNSPDMFNNLVRMASTADPSFTPNSKVALTITDKGDVIEVSQNATVKDGDEKISVPQPVYITKADFARNNPDLYSRLNFERNAAIYTYERMQGEKLISPPVTHYEDKTTDLYRWGAKVLLSSRQHLVPFLTSTETKTFLKSSVPMLRRENQNLDQIINNAVDESSDYGVQMEIKSNFGSRDMYIKLVHKDTGEQVHAMELPNVQDLDDFKPTLDSAPQVYFGMLIQDILSRQETQYITGDDYPAYTKLIQTLNQSWQKKIK